MEHDADVPQRPRLEYRPLVLRQDASEDVRVQGAVQVRREHNIADDRVFVPPAHLRRLLHDRPAQQHDEERQLLVPGQVEELPVPRAAARAGPGWTSAAHVSFTDGHGDLREVFVKEAWPIMSRGKSTQRMRRL
ncbi:type II secretion system F family protein [Babesia caballi]|uniref:Type II secretion system F family protein n=1 Tax=Babesia caballi TaxID=5871 RepID=A0AAV4M1V9_BABCB|nr:type II secretion system F family protein [Babesia caballi]